VTERLSWRFVAIAAFFVTALVVSNVIAVKLVEVSGRVFPAGLVVFPLFLALAALGGRPRAHVAIVSVSSIMLGVAIVQWSLWQWVA